MLLACVGGVYKTIGKTGIVAENAIAMTSHKCAVKDSTKFKQSQFSKDI